MVRSKGLDKSDQQVNVHNRKDVFFLRPEEKRELENRIKSSERYLQTYKSSEFRAERDRDVSSIHEQIKKDKKTLSELSAPPVTSKDKTLLYSRCKELEKQIKVGMPTKDEMMGKRKTNPNKSKYQEAESSVVEKNIKWTLSKEPLVREWKRIKRTLEPDDPTVTDVEQLRKIH